MRYGLVGIGALALLAASLGAVWPDLTALLPRYWATFVAVVTQLRDVLRVTLLAGAAAVTLLAWVAQRRQPKRATGTMLAFRPRQPSQERRAA